MGDLWIPAAGEHSPLSSADCSLPSLSSQRTDARGLPQVTKVSESSSGTVITLVSIAVVVLVLAMAAACLRHYTQQVANGKLGLGPEGGTETHFDYQVRRRFWSKEGHFMKSTSGRI